MEEIAYQAEKTTRMYGRAARFARWLLRLCSRRYACEVKAPAQPCVYVCRHLNMHGPFVTIKWLPFELHPFVLSIFTDAQSAARQYAEYTFTVRMGKPRRDPGRLCNLAGKVASAVVQSLQPVPVHRDGTAVKTMRESMKYLQKGESLIVWPDVHYTEGYDKPCEIYNGFLYLGELYLRATGQELPFIPLYVDDKRRVITEGKPIVVRQFRTDAQDAAEKLEKALNGPDAQ